MLADDHNVLKVRNGNQGGEGCVSFIAVGPPRFHNPLTAISPYNRVVYRRESCHFVELGEVLNKTQRESAYPDGFLARTLRLVSHTRNFLLRTPAKNPQKWDIVLLGSSGAETKKGPFLNNSSRRIHGVNLLVSPTVSLI